jgi:hypothetical protein
VASSALLIACVLAPFRRGSTSRAKLCAETSTASEAGLKRVLFNQKREFRWGSHTHVKMNVDELLQELG